MLYLRMISMQLVAHNSLNHTQSLSPQSHMQNTMPAARSAIWASIYQPLAQLVKARRRRLHFHLR